ncbi:hypothetical protein EMGBS8_00480 [Verrucomicrobiota bacterium]|nr:hypothetical protein EMGBS8_00480 [Verrucomicrobiota bacterium]
MQIHVARPPAQLGVFSQEEVAAGLQDGRFLPSDQGWREGMSAWTPLSQWEEFAGLGIPSAPPESAQASTVQPMPAWERGSSIGSFFGTIKDVALDPVQTFDNLPAQGGFGRPLLYNYLTTFPALLLLAALYALFFAVMGETILEGMRADSDTPQFLQNLSVGGLVGLLFGLVFCLALFAPLALFVSSAFTYFLLLPWSPRGGYAGSFRANAYVNGAFFPLTCIPCLNYVAAPWQMVVNVIALSRVHQIAWWKVLISVVVIPCCLCCGVYAAVLLPLLTKMR